jgi:trimeric autotransporter adhesin
MDERFIVIFEVTNSSAMKKLTFISTFLVFNFSFFILKAQTINTIAGSAIAGYGGDGGQATVASLNNPIGVAVDVSGNLYIGDWDNNRVRKVNTSGIITTIAGIGIEGYSGDGGQATAAEISTPGGLAIDTLGNVYIPELAGNRIQKVDVSTGIITTVAGDGVGGSGGDGGAATAANLDYPTGVALDKKGNLYIADDINNRVRIVDTSGVINTYAGNGIFGYGGDGGPATAAELEAPTGLASDAAGNLYFGDQENSRIRVVNSSGIISTYAGNGVVGYTGNAGPATAAELDHPEEVALDASGNLYIDDEGNDEIRIVSPAGTIKRFAGVPTIGNFSGDGGPASAAELSGPQGVCADYAGNIYIADFGNNRVRKVTTVITGNEALNYENIVTVYPNPAKEELNIELNGILNKVVITLYNIEGEQIINQSFSNQSIVTLNTSGYPDGLYILRMQKEDGTTIIKKVEIQK